MMIETSTPLSGAQARRERGRREMRTAIVASAERLVAEHGLRGLTIRAVASDLGYSPGALYEYVSSKEEIVAALYFEGSDGLGVHCEHAIAGLPPAATAADALLVVGRAYRAYALAHAELYSLLFSASHVPTRPRDAECGEEPDHEGGFGTTMRVMARGIADGIFIDRPAPLLATVAWAAVHGFVQLEITGLLGWKLDAHDDTTHDTAHDASTASRDDAFESLLRMTLFGLMKDRHDPA